METAIVVLSGGLDSTTALYWAKKKFQYVEAITFNYGSKHNDTEYCYAWNTCHRLGVKLTRIQLDAIGQYFCSSLLKGGDDIPEGSYNAENMKSTVVPFRNGIMLAVCAGYAESYGFKYLVLGNHSGDHAIYPDCTPEFVNAMNSAIYNGTGNHVRLLSPFCNMSKADIVKYGSELDVDFSLTYSCYNGRKHHCGKCGTCVERKEAFRLAGIYDPTIYEE